MTWTATTDAYDEDGRIAAGWKDVAVAAGHDLTKAAAGVIVEAIRLLIAVVQRMAHE